MTHNLQERYLTLFIRQDLQEKLVFLSGPRQVGKTTLALKLLGGNEAHPAYFNWDDANDQRKLLAQEFPLDQRLLVFDEIHKYTRWRNWLKGLYDKTRSKRQYLITGSARLDLYRRGGDALTGRYHSYHLHPLSLAEVDTHFHPKTVDALLRFGGFPEPFFAQSERSHRRWQLERHQQVLRDDLRDLEKVNEVTQVALLAERLPSLIGSPLSINAVREDLQVAHGTLQNWLAILERLYVFFRISPFGGSKIRAVKKEQKAYLWDWSTVSEEGARFENMVACQLLKYCHFLENTEGHRMELRYIRDTDKREVDFVVTKEEKPLFAVECQTKDNPIPSSLFYFMERLNIPEWYFVHLGTKNYEHATTSLRILPFHVFAQDRQLP